MKRPKVERLMGQATRSSGAVFLTSDMEREQYQKQIKDLLQAVETLLKSNKAMGERVAQLETVAETYDDLKAKYDKLEGELAVRKRGQHGKRSEKPYSL